MIRQNKTHVHPWLPFRASLVLVGLAASSCGSDSNTAEDSKGVTTLPTQAQVCAQNPRAVQCTNPAEITPTIPATSTGAAGAAPITTRPATQPVTPTAPMTPPPTLPPAGAAGAAAPATPPAMPPGQAPGTPPAPPAAGAPAAGAAGAAAPAGPGSNLAGISDDELNTLRQACVDEINMYRATLTMNNLKPMKRANQMQETCSDNGAQMDGDSNQAHGAAKAGLCRSVGLGAENTCPGWPVGGRNGTLTDAMKNCLKSMWGEGEPPVSRADCQKDYEGCFLKYGHYLNMSDPNNLVASCGFYKMKTGAYWMNQDFGYK